MWLDEYVAKVKTDDEATLTAYLVEHGAVIAQRVGGDEDFSDPPLTTLVVSLYYNSEITPEQAENAVNAYISALRQLDGIDIDSIVNPDGRSCVTLPLGQAVIAYYNALRESGAGATSSLFHEAATSSLLKASSLIHSLIHHGAKPELVDQRTGNVTRLVIPHYWKSELDIEVADQRRGWCAVL